jgi:hypothetical protein
MDILDSRYLTSQDSFTQLFGEADTYEYRVTAAPRGLTPKHEPSFRLTVKSGKTKKGAGQQHRVAVIWDAAARHYAVEPRHLEIDQNDFVTWHCERMAGSPPYAVRGTGAHGSFDSAALGPNAVFTHFFVQPGAYQCRVNGGKACAVEVIDHRQVAAETYSKRTQEAHVVQIKKDGPDRGRLEIVAGQTVIWTVENEEDVVIRAHPVGEPAVGEPAIGEPERKRQHTRR